MTRPFDVDDCRKQFPALSRKINGQTAVFFDGPAGSQVPRRVADAVSDYLLQTNANHEGVFITSRESDQMLAEAHRAVADFLGADDPDTVMFGANMTTLTFALSRALAKTWQAGDEVIVTRSDHDANVTPWILAAQDAGVKVRQVNIRREDCTLDLDDLRSKLSSRTRLAAIGAASNASGTIHPVREICDLVHDAGAEVFVDAVHYAPHRSIDVEAFDCDYLACSAYKFFGPHVGILWGRRRRMEALPAYKLRPAADEIPDRWMTGTQNHEGIAGTLAAIDYLAELGRSCDGQTPCRRDAIVAAFDAIRAYELQLLAPLLEGLGELPDITVWGISDPARLSERVPTICFTHRHLSPRQIAERLAEEGIFVWHGNYYALSLTESLGLEPEGAVRVGILHYNTAEEVERLLASLRRISA